MREVMATVSSKGQVVIPAEVRKFLGVEQGDKVLFVLGEDGKVELKSVKYPTVASLRGAAGKLAQPLTWDEMQQIASEDRLQESRNRR